MDLLGEEAVTRSAVLLVSIIACTPTTSAVADASIVDSSIVDTSIVDAPAPDTSPPIADASVADTSTKPVSQLSGWAPGDGMPVIPRENPNPPAVDVGVVLVGTSVGDVQQVVLGLKNGGRACYLGELVKNPMLAGRVTYEVKLSYLGEVQSVTEKPGGTIGHEVSNCLQHRIGSASFHPGANATFDIAWTFSTK